MKFKKILIVGILAMVIVVLFLALKEEVKIPNVNEAFALLKENYSADITNNYSVINITNGWRFEFLKIEGNCSLECIKRNIYFEVYKNGSIVRSEKSMNITIIESENDALNYILFRFPEFNISNNYSVINITNGWRFEFLRTEENRSIERIEKYVDFWVYKNGSITKSEKSTNITKIESETDALNYVLFRFPEFKNISKCEFEEKLMCHEDVIIEKVNNKWNVTFMKESKGCDNECVIRRYYSFLVEKDRKIRKDINEKKMGLEDILGEGINYSKDIKGSAYVIQFLFGTTEGESCIGTANILDVLSNEGWICSSIKRNVLLFINEDKKIVYKTNKNVSFYNILLEKFSTKTINNESDVLEAFGRYLDLFGECSYGGKKGMLTGKENDDKTGFIWRWIPLAEYEYNFSLLEHKPVVAKKDGFWELNCSTWCGFDWTSVKVVRHKVKVSDRGSVNILDKKEYVYKDVILYYR